MPYERTWELLIEHLDALGHAREVPGGIAVTIEQQSGQPREVELVVSPDEWDDFVSTMYGDGDPERTGIREAVLATPVGARYLVYRMYDWSPSLTPDLPEDRLEPEPGGAWVVTDDDGNVLDRFRDSHEPD